MVIYLAILGFDDVLLLFDDPFRSVYLLLLLLHLPKIPRDFE
jgi:hypothetical protein